MSTPDYSGRTALVTGASAGLGREFATRYAALGADVVLVARRKERLEDVAHGIEAGCGVKAFVLPQDLSLPDAHTQLMSVLAGLDRSVDILVNNAGFSIAQTYAASDWSRQHAFLMTLTYAVASLSHAVLPAMVEQKWGRILNVASMVAYAPGGVGHTLYPAAKAFVLRLSQSLHQELHGTGVHCTATSPGSTDTEFRAANGIDTGKSGGMFVQSAEEVVIGAMKASEKNRSVHVPGWHNKLAVGLMQILPDQWTMPLIRRASGKVLSDQNS